jgi:hypothetical protein
MLFDIEKIAENVKQDPRTTYLECLGQAIKNLSSKNPSNTDCNYFPNQTDHNLRMVMITKLHEFAMMVIDTLEK